VPERSLVFSVKQRLLVTLVLFVLTAAGLAFHDAYLAKLKSIALSLESKINRVETLMDRLSTEPAFEAVTRRALLDTINLKTESSEFAIIGQIQKAGLIALVYNEGKPKFWSSNLIVPERPDLFPMGLSYTDLRNGSYLVKRIRKNRGDAIFLCQVKSQYDLHNTYLDNAYNTRFGIPDYLLLTRGDQGHSEAIRSSLGNTLFFISISDFAFKRTSDGFSAVGWALLLALFYYWVKLLTFHFASKRSTIACLFLGVVVPLGVRVLMILYRYPTDLYNLRLFSPLVYSSSSLFHSLGDFFLNACLVAWVSYMILKLFTTRLPASKNTVLKWVILILCGTIQISFYYLFEKLFKGMIENSNIPYDLTNILSTNNYTIQAFILLASSWLCFYLVSTVLNKIVQMQGHPQKTVILFICGTAALFAMVDAIRHEHFYYYLLCGALSIVLFSLAETRKLRIIPVLTLVLLISLVTSLRLLEYGTQKENVSRLAFAERLEKSSDPVSEFLLKDNEEKISRDSVLGSLLKLDRNRIRPSIFRLATQRLQNIYFGRNFSRFDLQSFLYDSRDELVSGPDVYTLRVFRSAASSPGIRRVSAYFYQLLTSLPDYIGIIPLEAGRRIKGTLVIRISARYLGENNSFPELLMDGKTSFERREETYSYAYYKTGSLLDKYGRFPYSITSTELTEGLAPGRTTYREYGGYNHLIYRPDAQNEIVVSEPETTFFKEVAVFSYVLSFNLIVLSLAAALIYMNRLFGKAHTLGDLVDLLRRQRFLYKTRIRLSLITGVFISLAVVGWVTLVYINNQYEGQQRDLVSNRIDNLRKAFENEMPVDSIGNVNESYNLQFLALASRQGTDLNFFDTNGDLQYTTLPKLFDRALISMKMEPRAFYEMYVSGKTELVNEEKIGKLSFLSVYAPVRNSLNQVAGYINLPYFANQSEINRKLSNFVSALINVYVLVFLLIGLLAFVLASSITNPLALIQNSLKRIEIGNTNQILVWKSDDEIGDLIRAYNQMVKALEESANRLARSERESAWREMAKQVAHEIKNPLTPLKLGIQHLEQAWKRKDERFEEKFKSFSHTFIEQIDSLSAIASEFSDFAKMPQAREEMLDIEALAVLSADLFKGSKYLEIALSIELKHDYSVFADRDQMLRVFNNLLKNAQQAIPSGKVGKVILSMWRLQSTIYIEIKDNGTGISQELQSHIFTPNFTTKSSGMGLGLAFVKNAVESARGRVGFTSGTWGTAFILELPAGKEEFVASRTS